MGDVSSLSGLSGVTDLRMNNTSVTYTATTLPDWKSCYFDFRDCNWTSTMVDDFLINLDSSSGDSTKTIRLYGNNAPRTSDSDSAMTSLTDTKGWTVIVNE